MTPNVNGRGLRWLFYAVVLLALFTGFGNMPLYGRYYIADIPGFQWSGNFIVNLKVHLLTGALLLALTAYTLVGMIHPGRNQARPPRTALDRAVGVALVLTLVSGLIAGLKNFAGWTPGLGLMITINFFHLGTAVMLTTLGAASLLVRPQDKSRPDT